MNWLIQNFLIAFLVVCLFTAWFWHIADAYLKVNQQPVIPYYGLNHGGCLVGWQIPRCQIKEIEAVITAYNPIESQCDSSPLITASGLKVREGIIANNCLKFGDWVEVDGRIYQVEDRMNKRWGCEHFDILVFDYEQAKDWGRQSKIIKVYY